MRGGEGTALIFQVEEGEETNLPVQSNVINGRW